MWGRNNVYFRLSVQERSEPLVSEAVQTFFQELGDDLLDAEMFSFLRRLDLPLAIYLGEDAFIFRDQAKVMRGLRAYSLYLWSLDVTRCRVTRLEQRGRRGSETCFAVSLSYYRSDGTVLGESRSRYYLAEEAQGEALRIRMIEVDRLPVDSLPFFIGDFQ